MLKAEMAIQGLVDTINYPSFAVYVVQNFGDDLDKDLYEELTKEEKPLILETILGGESQLRKTRKEWREKETKAIGLITKLVTETYYADIEKLATPFEMFEKLRERFNSYKLANSLQYRVQFYQAYQAKDENLNHFIDRMLNLANKLEEIGEPLKPIEIVFKIIASMNEKYNSIVQTFCSAPDENFTIEYLRKQAILDQSIAKTQERRSERKFQKPEEVNALNNRPNANQTICRMFNQPGGCRYGNNCKFAHRNADNNNNNNSNNNSNNSNSNNNNNNTNNNNNNNNRNNNSGNNNNVLEASQKENTSSKSKSKEKKEKASLVIEKQVNQILLVNDEKSEDFIYADSGSTIHLTKSKFNLTNQNNSNSVIIGAIASEGETRVTIKGEAAYETLNQSQSFTLEDTSYSENARHHLASVSKICCETDPKAVIFDNEKVIILPKESVHYQTEDVLLKGKLIDGLYAIGKLSNSNSINLAKEKSEVTIDEKGEGSLKSFNTKNVSPQQDEQKAENSNEELMQWHKRLGHININDIEILQKQNLLPGLSKINAEDKEHFECKNCPLGKMSRLPYQKETKIYAENIGDVIISDLYGPIHPRTINGYRYNAVYVDAKSRESFIFQLKRKSEQPQRFKELIAYLDRQRNVKVKRLHCDPGGEYISNNFKKWLKRKGILLTFNPKDTPQRTGIAERLNRTIPEMARTMLFEANLSKNLWNYSFNYANQIRNMKPMRILNNKSPYQIAKNKDPELIKLKPFGCAVYYRNDRVHKLGKLEERAKEGYFIGYNEEERTYLIWNQIERKVVRSRDVKFYENEVNENTEESSSSESDSEESEESSSEESQSTRESSSEEESDDEEEDKEEEKEEEVEIKFSMEGSESESESEGDNDINNEIINIDENNDNNIQVPNVRVRIEPIVIEREEEIRRYPRRENRTNVDDYFKTKVLSAEEIDLDTPSTYKEAINSENSEKWKISMNEELNSLKKMKVFKKIEELPRNSPIVGSKWVYKIKINPKGELEKFKSRLVAKGYTQTYGIDYFETFSPVVRYETLRYLFTYALQNDLDIDVTDINTAFLYAELNEEVYMRLPEGCDDLSNNVVKLGKAIYGTKQAANNWNSTLKLKLIKANFDQSQADPCLYIKKMNDGTLLIVAIYVDDLTVIGKRNHIDDFKKFLRSNFEIKDLGPIKSLLGINIIRTNNTISLDQSYYIKKLLKYFQLEDANTYTTPALPNTTESTTDDTKNSQLPFNNNTYFRQAVGSLNHLCRCTRPDISYAVNVVATKVVNPTNEDWNRIKRIFQYLKLTIDKKLTYSKEDISKLEGYADADYASTKTGEDKRKSISGYVFIKNQGAISWKSKKQPIIANSSMESEYIALHAASNEALWLRKLQNELEKENSTITIYEDNQSAIHQTEHEVHSDRSKHIDVKYHSIRERVALKQIAVKYMPTANQTADIFTKALQANSHRKHTAALGLTN
jgi:hypothetical protein